MIRFGNYRPPEPKPFFEPDKEKLVTEREAVILHAARILFIEFSFHADTVKRKELGIKGDVRYFELSSPSHALKHDWPPMKMIYAEREQPKPIAIYLEEPYICRRLTAEEFLSFDHPKALFNYMTRRQKIPSNCLYKEGNSEVIRGRFGEMLELRRIT